MTKKQILKSKIRHKNSFFIDVKDLAINPTRETNQDILLTLEMIHPIEVEPIEGSLRTGVGGAVYRGGCEGKKYTVHKGNSRVKAARQLGFTHIEGIYRND